MSKRIAIIASSIDPIKQGHLLEWYDDLILKKIECKLFIGSKTQAVPYAENYKLNSRMEKIKYLFKGKIAKKNQPLIDYNPEIIHLLTSNTFQSIRSSLKKNTKLVVSFRGYDINVFPTLSDENLKITQEVFERADTLHFISKGLRDNAVLLGADPSKSIVIKRSLNFTKLMKTSSNDVIDDKIVILSVCRLVWEKGLLYALEAIAKLVKLNYNIQYIIIGDGIDKNALLYHVKRLKLEDTVVFLGYLSKKESFAYYEKASIYLQPSLQEALSNSIMEASFFGLPVVATNTGGIPEVVEHGRTGLLAPIANSDKLFEYLIRLIEDKELRLEYGRNANIKMKEEFNRNKEINEWLEIYNTLK